ncbi:tetratricopeptide repeat protein 5-like [Zerene cesonia]|uniref:tetratricopeptide repeat protein 5-like n=1 Tax=Zerene cesonia TaxID=33412 RepID=UPI0018E57B97|nr:tetratricopeptide repeat protein 5-like [Zerene cesonia]
MAEDAVHLDNANEYIENLSKELQELITYRDMFFENNPIEKAKDKHKCVEEKKENLIEKFENIDVDTQIPFPLRAKFQYLKGRCYNVSLKYDSRATQCLSKAVKLNPHMVEAWNELGECYWKNINVKEARACFEGALKHERNRITLRCLSIILRQEASTRKDHEATQMILKSVDYAKEAVSQDIKDGQSWIILGNSYLCQYFTVSQDPAILKQCMSAYKQAYLDPIARGQPDLYYNKAIALKYEENYSEALETFNRACDLDPLWMPPDRERIKLRQFLASAVDLLRTRGKIKCKRLANMLQAVDKKMLGDYTPGSFVTIGSRRDVILEQVRIDALQEGANENKVILGRVVGSIHSENAVPFAFGIIDESMKCMVVTAYNWAAGRGTLIGDWVAIPEPYVRTHNIVTPEMKYMFKSIRVNNPMTMFVNGRRVERGQVAGTRVSSTYEMH